MPLSNASGLALGLIVLIGIVFLAAGHLLVKELRTDYPDLYVNIGRPALFAPRSIIEQWRFIRFIILRKYRSIANKRIRVLGDIVLLCSIINLGLIFCLVVFNYNDFHQSIE
jgi:hypothetical protein